MIEEEGKNELPAIEEDNGERKFWINIWEKRNEDD
jgi:hypothetical protein